MYGLRFYFVVIALSGCAQLPAPQKPAIEKDSFTYARTQLTWLINKAIKEENIAGLSIALVANDQSVWQQGFGYANKATHEKVNPQTLFRAGSLAKVFIALAVLELHQQGQLDIDAPIINYLPEFTKSHSDASAITLRQLLSHQSGLPSDLIKGMWTNQPTHYTSSLGYLKNTTFPHPPEQLVLYSNLGFNLIAAVVEARTQTPAIDYMNAFLQRLNMHNSAYSASPIFPPTAQSYHKGRKKKELPLRDVPAAGLSTNVADLAQFYQQLLSANVSGLNTNNLNQMFIDHSSSLPLNFGKRVGLGMFYYDGIFHPKFPLFGHNGATVNHRSVIKFSRDGRYGVALLSNDRAAAPALHRIANTALALLHEASTGRPAPHYSLRWPKPSPADVLEPQKILGHYASPLGLIKISQKNQTLHASIGGKRLRLYQRENNGLYYLRYRLFGLFPIDLGYIGNLGFALQVVDNHSYLIAHTTYGTRERIGIKLSSHNIPKAWQERVGHYEVVNPLTAMKLYSGGIKLEDGFLVAYARTEQGDKLQVVLKPINDYEAEVTGIGRGLGERVRVLNTSLEEQLIYSNILFEKKK